MRKNLEVKGKEIYLNGEKIQILSGAIHYFRVVPEYWEDRLKKLKNCGLNTVETYVPWNLHEPEEGEFCFDGICDMERFFKTADALGLYVIVRPSPYICAEWEGGGLPYWLLCYKDLKPRCSNELYFEKVGNYYNELMPRIKKHLFKNGGPIIAVQVENEYGSFGNDKEYISRLYRLMLSYELDTFFFTADGTEKYMLNGGLTDGVFATANFGSDPEGNFEALDARRPNQPHFCMEYWCGWFDHWGEKPHKRDAEDIVAPLKRMRDRGEHFNIYMFHGGTNFGFMNGANYADTYQPTVTSYDYGAFLTENGEYTEQYRLLKNELSRYSEKPDIPCKPIPLRSYGEIRLTESARLFDNLERISALTEDTVPRSFEELHHPYGFVLYRTKVAADTTAERLKLNKVRDRVWVYADGKPLGIIDRMGISDDEIWLGGNENEVTLDLLAENLGRINYGPKLLDKKGIDFPVMIGQQQQFGYKMYPIDFERISELEFKEGAVSDGTPVFLYGELYADECADTFLDMSGFTKGCVFINGFNLGRYWNIGPTLDLYIPAPLIKKGKNEIVIFETERFERDYITANDYGVNTWAMSTYEARRSLIFNYINPIIGDVKLSDLNTRVMEKYYQNLLKVKSRVVNNRKPNNEYLSCHVVREIHKLLRCAFNQAVKWELMPKNPCINATLPKEEHKTRDIWDAPTLFKALELCDDDILKLAINLAFSCSLRMGEMLGLTWDCVEISDASIANGTAFVFVNKELQRVNRDALEKLNEKGIVFKFPAFVARTNTALVLKEPKTKTSTRKVFLPKTVAEMLKVRYQEIQEYKELFGDEFYDYNLVFCNANGRPLEHQIITRSLQKLIRENDLPPVVFHSLRHSSITYKLKLNGGDIKSVQGDSGHAQVKMVTDVYSHILDEDRRLNAQRFEETFYQQKNLSAVNGATVEPTPATPPAQEPQAITEEAMLNYMVQNPEFLQKFKVLLGVGN